MNPWIGEIHLIAVDECVRGRGVGGAVVAALQKKVW